MKSLAIVLVLSAWGASSAGAAPCAAEKKGLANAIKMRHQPMAIATATFTWAECERAQLEAMKWPAKINMKKLQAEVVKRQKQLQVVGDAYQKAVVANDAEPRWKLLGAFALAHAQHALAEQFRNIPVPAFKGKPDEQKELEAAFRNAVEQPASAADAAAVRSLKLGLDVAAANRAPVASSSDLHLAVEDACNALFLLASGETHPACPQPAPPRPRG